MMAGVLVNWDILYTKNPNSPTHLPSYNTPLMEDVLYDDRRVV